MLDTVDFRGIYQGVLGKSISDSQWWRVRRMFKRYRKAIAKGIALTNHRRECENFRHTQAFQPQVEDFG